MLRLWSAQLDGRTSHVDARIRDVVGPRAASTPGLLAFYPARRGTDTDAGRIIATVLIWAWIMYRLWPPLRTEEDEA